MPRSVWSRTVEGYLGFPKSGHSETEFDGEDAVRRALREGGFEVSRGGLPDRGIDLIAARRIRGAEGSEAVSPHLLAFQVKAGPSYTRSSGGKVSVGDHSRYWSEASMPVLLAVLRADGRLVVQDPFSELVNFAAPGQSQAIDVSHDFKESMTNIRARAVLGALYPQIWTCQGFGTFDYDAGDVGTTISMLAQLGQHGSALRAPLRHWVRGLHYVGLLMEDRIDSLQVQKHVLDHSGGEKRNQNRYLLVRQVDSSHAPRLIEAGVTQMAMYHLCKEIYRAASGEGELGAYQHELFSQHFDTRHHPSFIGRSLVMLGELIGAPILKDLSGLGSCKARSLSIDVLVEAVGGECPVETLECVIKTRCSEIVGAAFSLVKESLSCKEDFGEAIKREFPAIPSLMVKGLLNG